MTELRSRTTFKHNHCKAWRVVLTASLFFFYSFIQLNLFSSIDVPLMRAFHLNAVQLGQLSALYFYGNVLFLVPAGILLDRYSTKKLLLTAISLTVIGTFLFVSTLSWKIAGIGRFCIGIGASFCFLSCIRLATRWFLPSQMALVTGTIVTMAMLGGLMAQTPMAMLSQWLGWRPAVLLDGVLGVIIFLLVSMFVSECPPDQIEKMRADRKHLKTMGLWQSMRLVIFNKHNWFGGLYSAFMNLPVFLLGAIWGIHYLARVHHLSIMQASYATTFFFVGVILGAPAFGWFSDFIQRRTLPMFIGAALSLVAVLALMFLPGLSLGALIGLFFIIGFVTSSQVLSYPVVAELNPGALTSSAISIVSMSIMLSGVIFQPLFGWAMQLNWDHTMSNGAPVYSANDLWHAMIMVPIAFALALMIVWMIKETHCKPQV